MKSGRKQLNILLIILAIILGGVAVWLYRLPPLVLSKSDISDNNVESIEDENINEHGSENSLNREINTIEESDNTDLHTGQNLRKNNDNPISGDTRITPEKSLAVKDFNLNAMISNHPFSKEVRKILSGELEEGDSVNRRKILNYCEHLRSSYSTKDIDFLRQVFSDDALIITGNIVKNHSEGVTNRIYSDRVIYTLHTKHSYLERIKKIFDNNKKIDIAFSDFQILRHPTVEGIYGVRLRQKYKSDRYEDDGYLFLLWDFRNKSMPMIHVRTWQPLANIADEEDLIDLGDFSLE